MHARVCVCVHYNERTTPTCMGACVYTFESYVSMCVTFSLLCGRIFTLFPCIFRGNCFFHLLWMLFFAGIPFSSILLLFIRVFAKSTFFMFLRTKFASTLSKPQVNTQCDRGKFFGELSIMISKKNISIDAGTRLIRPESMKLLFGYVVIFYIL